VKKGGEEEMNYLGGVQVPCPPAKAKGRGACGIVIVINQKGEGSSQSRKRGPKTLSRKEIYKREPFPSSPEKKALLFI